MLFGNQTPRPFGYGNTTVMHIRRAKITSHTYAKHNSTARNQSTEAQWLYTFQHYSPSTLLSQHVIQYYKNIISLEHAKVRITRDLQDKSGRCSWPGKGSRKSDKGDGSGELFDMISHFCQVLILELTTLPLHTPSSLRNSLILQAPGSGHANLGLSGCNPVST